MALVWPSFVKRRYMDSGPANQVGTLVDTYKLGGVKGRWMSNGWFELAPGKVLLIATPKTRAKYQAIQLTDAWYNSLEYANQVSSLTTQQSLMGPDGVYYTVVSSEDPGHANWLDTGGLTRGTFMLRYDGVLGEIPEGQYPSARLVDLADLPALIPGFTRVTESERAATRATRRRHQQIRSGR